jgi:hypothetical protein
MDDLLHDTQAMGGMLLHAFQQIELGDDDDVIDTYFESLESASTPPFFGQHGSRSTKLGTIILLYNLKSMHVMSATCFSTLLR